MQELLLKLSPEWTLAGSHPQEYDFGESAASDGASGFVTRPTSIKSAVAQTHGYGTMVHTINADAYRGMSVSFKGRLKVENLKGWAGLWMRSSGGTPVTRFDNMQNRNSTHDGWHHCECSIDVPDSASHIAFGALLHGSGELWIGEIQFETSFV